MAMVTISDWTQHLVLDCCLRLINPANFVCYMIHKPPGNQIKNCGEYLRHISDNYTAYKPQIELFCGMPIYKDTQAFINTFGEFCNTPSTPDLKTSLTPLPFRIYDGIIYGLVYRFTLGLPQKHTHKILTSLLKYLKSERLITKNSINSGVYMRHIFNKMPDLSRRLCDYCEFHGGINDSYHIYDYDVATLKKWECEYSRWADNVFVDD